MAEMDYKGSHRPDPNGTPLHRAEEAFPGIFERPRDYVHSAEHYPESLRVIAATRGKPDEWVIAYRAAPPEVRRINPGDWVSLSRTYAEQHAVQDDDPSHDWPILERGVLASSLITDGNDINEWGWFPQPEHTCKDGSIQPGIGAGCCDDFWRGVR